MSLIATLLLFLNLAAAKPILVITPGLTIPEDLKSESKRLNVTYPQFVLKSSFEHMLENPISQVEFDSLQTLRNQAQEHSLSGHFQKASESYEALVEKLQNMPITPLLRNFVFETLIERAETLSLLDSKSGHLSWKEAAAFFPGAKLPPEIFSPATITHFQKVTKGLKSAQLTIKTPPGTSLWIDGEKRKEQSLVVRGTHFVAALTPGGQWFFQTIKVQDSQNSLDINPEPLLKGHCHQPLLNIPPHWEKFKVIASFDGCERFFDGTKWYTVEGTPLPKLSPVFDPSVSLDMEVSDSPKKSVLKNPWLWVGIGVVASGIFLSTNTKKGTPIRIPTHKK